MRNIREELVECMKKELSEFKFPPRRCDAYFPSLDLVSSTVLSARWVHNRVFKECIIERRGFSGGSVVKNLPANAGDAGSVPGWGRTLGGGEEPLEEGTATHSSILAWRIPWTEEPEELQLIGSQRVGHD